MAEKFKNKMLLLPKNLLREINIMIDRNDVGSRTILKVLKDRYQGPLELPSVVTIQAYLDWRKRERTKAPAGTNGDSTEIQEINQQLEELGGDEESERFSAVAKKDALGKLIDKCYKRIEDLTTISPENMSASEERVVVTYITEIRKIIETLLKLSGELQADDKVIVHLIDQKVGQYFQVISRTIQEIYGTDKLLEFKERLKQNLTETV